jgi:hypothetical protein
MIRVVRNIIGGDEGNDCACSECRRGGKFLLIRVTITRAQLHVTVRTEQTYGEKYQRGYCAISVVRILKRRAGNAETKCIFERVYKCAG